MRCSGPTASSRSSSEELAFHIEREARKLIDEGMAPAEARRARAGALRIDGAGRRSVSRRARYRGHRQHHSRRSVRAAHVRQGAARRIHDRRHRGASDLAWWRCCSPFSIRSSSASTRCPTSARCTRSSGPQPANGDALAADAADIRRDASRHACLHGRLRDRARHRSSCRRPEDGGHARHREFLPGRSGQSGHWPRPRAGR